MNNYFVETFCLLFDEIVIDSIYSISFRSRANSLFMNNSMILTNSETNGIDFLLFITVASSRILISLKNSDWFPLERTPPVFS